MTSRGKSAGLARGRSRSAPKQAASRLSRPGRVTAVAPADKSTSAEQFADDDPQSQGRQPEIRPEKVILEVSSLPPQITTDEIETYFEGQGDNIEILSTVNLGSRNARVILSGLTAEELEKMQKKRHKIKKQPIHVEISMDINVALPKPPQPTAKSPPSDILDTLEVSGLPPNADRELLELYFENPRSGSLDGAVEECSIVSPGTAHIKFQSPEVAAKVLSISGHAVQGSTLQLQYAKTPKVPEEEPAGQYEANKLLIRQIPQNVDEEHLQLFLEKVLRMEHQDGFVVEVSRGSAVITFLDAQLSNEELVKMISKLGSKPLKGVTVQAELCKVASSIRVQKVTRHYDEEYFEMYFESPKRSGGGDVASIQLLGNGEAVVTFKDPKVLASVLQKSHTTFGETVVVEREDPELRSSYPEANTPPLCTEHSSCRGYPVTIPTDTNTHHPLVITVDPLIVKSLHNDPRGLKQCLQSLNVEVTIDGEHQHVVIAPTTHTMAGWKQEADRLASSYINSEYKKVEIKFPKEAAAELLEFLVSVQQERSLTFSFDQQSHLLEAAGDSSAIDMLQTRSDEICSGFVQISDTMELNECDYNFLSQVKALQIASVHPDVRINYDSANHAILLQGSVRSVTQFKKFLPECIYHDSVTTELDPSIVRYFQTDSGIQQLIDFIRNKNCSVAIHFSAVPQLRLLFLCDPSQTEVVKSLSRDVQKATNVKSEPLKVSFARMLPEFEAEYRHVCHNLQMQQHVEIVTSDNQVTIAGFKKGVSKGIQAINEFIKEKCNVTSPVEIERGMWRLFHGPMQEKWRKIVAQCQQNGVELMEPDEDDNNRVVLLVKGDTTFVTESCQNIHAIVKSVAKASVMISRPGTCKYFQSNEHAGMLLAGIEQTEHVCIEKGEVDDSIHDDQIPDPDDTPGAKFTKVCVARTKEFKQIVVYVGDITEFDKADVIVNAANGDLQHIGGVAAAIAAKGGSIIQQESSQRVKKSGKLDDGDVWFTTKVGALPCKALIHAVGPKWSGGHSKEKGLLSKACTLSLKKAYKYRSVAFPAISSGIFGFPLDECAHTLVKAAVEFSEKNPVTDLQEIYFVLIKQNDAQAFVKALEAQLPQEDIFVDRMTSTPKSTYPTSHPPSASAWEPSTGEETETSKKTKKRIATLPDCIILKQGSLTDVKADVYVNTTNTDLNLSHGGVAQALSAAAGPSLQEECKRKAPISVGGIAVTGGGKLQCRFVFHTVAAGYDGPGKQAEKILRNLVHKCMKECTKLRVTSIAFPAIGTGNLHFPNHVVAKVMVEAILSFLSSHKNSSFKAVYLVIFMADTHRAFQQKLAQLKSAPGTSYSSTPSSPQEFDNYTPTKPLHSPRHLAATASPQSDPNQRTFLLGAIRVQVLHGDITDDRSDIVVNPTNSTIQLAGPGVSGALLKKGGKELQKVCDTLTSQGVRLEEGKVIHTPATGALKCKFVFHIVFESKDHKKFLKTIDSCLHKAEELKCNSIAFPAIGTGTYGYPPDAAAKGMMKAIDQFAATKPTHVTCVRIVLFQQDTYQAFAVVFNDPESLSRPGLWQRTKDFVGSLLPNLYGPAENGGEHALSQQTSPGHEQMMYREIELVIYGETQAAIQKAEEKLQRIIDDQFITDKVEDPNIDQLTRSDIAKLEAMSKEMHVELDFNRAPLNFIRLKGDKTDVHKMKYHIIETLSEFEKRVCMQREAEQMQKIVQWKRMDSEETPYDMMVNYQVELAHKANKPSYTHLTAGEHYTVDLKKMQETDHLNKETFRIVRDDLIKKYQEGSEKPSHWDPMPPDPQSGKETALHCIDLSPGSKEYNKVMQEFNKTMTPAGMSSGSPGALHALLQPQPYYQSSNNYNSIVKIQRIQNPMLFSQFIAKKKDMDKHNPPGHQNEWQLFHGTPADICPKINQQGFNRSFAGKNATMLGRGVYFARDASYSARPTYSPPDANGYKYIYLARVLAGEFTVGNSSMILPPPKAPQHQTVPFDSVVDNTSNPQIFVVFFDAQTYPQYLIVFK